MKLYIAPAILQIIDSCQFGVIPKSSTAHALISMIHNLAQVTDATGATVRIVLIDYKKAFDLINHQILLQKVFSLHVPTSIARWVADFLTNRKQRVKLSHDSYLKKEHWPLFPPNQTYSQSLQKLNLTSLKERRSLLCDKWFSSIVSSESHKLHNLLPPLQEDNYKITNKRVFGIPKIHTERFKRTFIPSMWTNF